MTELDKVKDLWVRLGLRDLDFPVENMACHGCMPGNKCAYTDLWACIGTKGYENCGLCEEYPCERITSAFGKSEDLESRASKVCSQDEMDMLRKAFFAKKEYFDRINRGYRKMV